MLVKKKTGNIEKDTIRRIRKRSTLKIENGPRRIAIRQMNMLENTEKLMRKRLKKNRRSLSRNTLKSQENGNMLIGRDIHGR